MDISMDIHIHGKPAYISERHSNRQPRYKGETK